MADRLTQLQDCINQVISSKKRLYFWNKTNCGFSKQNIFVIALEFFSSLLHLANFLASIEVDHKPPNNKIKRIMCNCLPR